MLLNVANKYLEVWKMFLAQALSELNVNEAINCEPTLPLRKHYYFFIKKKQGNKHSDIMPYMKYFFV